MLFSTEMVSKYHPDKVADQISDAILTECLKEDKQSHVACETLIKGTTVVLGGEITTRAKLNYEQIAKDTVHKLGYKAERVENLITTQSVEINNAVGKEGAGDQGMMFGYACSGGKYYLPKALEMAIDIILLIEQDVQCNPDTILKGDAKTQITVDRQSGRVDTILLSACHQEGLNIYLVRDYLERIIPFKADTLLTNPAGLWTMGGPEADCGLTGRKIVCDQYGGFAPVGGGAFSGKDPSKVDRSASYMARKIAVELVKEYGLEEASVQLAYAIGQAEPVSVCAMGKFGGQQIDFSQKVKNNWDLTPAGMTEKLNLLNLDYKTLASGNHMIHFV